MKTEQEIKDRLDYLERKMEETNGYPVPIQDLRGYMVAIYYLKWVLK